MTNDLLRAAITAALRRRGTIDDLDVTPSLTLLGSRTSTASVVVYGPDGAVIDVVARASDDANALRGVACAVGLRDDGSDPAEEVERLRVALDDANNLASCQRDTIKTLTRALHAAADRLGCADYDDVCAAVSDALDDAEKREREHVDEANALRMERERLRVENVRFLSIMESISAQLCDATREFDAARAAVREHLAAESALNVAHEMRLNACYNPITSPDDLRATEDAHTTALLRRIAAREALRKIVKGE